MVCVYAAVGGRARAGGVPGVQTLLVVVVMVYVMVLVMAIALSAVMLVPDLVREDPPMVVAEGKAEGAAEVQVQDLKIRNETEKRASSANCLGSRVSPVVRVGMTESEKENEGNTKERYAEATSAR